MISKHVIQLGICCCLAGMFAYAAFTKLFTREDAQPPNTVYSQWSSSGLSHYSILFGEVVLAFWLLSGRASIASAIVAMAVLSAYSGAIAMELTKDRPLPCGCTGQPAVAISDSDSIRASLRLDLVRNCAMMAGATFLFFGIPSSKKRPVACAAVAAEPQQRILLPGFTMIEMVAVIGIISLMISLLMPSVSKARRAAMAVQCESNLRQIGLALTNYANNNRNDYPTWSGWQVYPNGQSSEDEPGLGWTEQIMQAFVAPTNPVYRCPEFPQEAQINYFLDVRWLAVQKPQLPCLNRSVIKFSSLFILSGDCTGHVFYCPPAGIANDHTTTDCDKTDEGFQALVFKGESGGMNMHPDGNNVLFADTHVECFPAFDPQKMTFNPHSMQDWQNCTP